MPRLAVVEREVDALVDKVFDDLIALEVERRRCVKLVRVWPVQRIQCVPSEHVLQRSTACSGVALALSLADRDDLVGVGQREAVYHVGPPVDQWPIRQYRLQVGRTSLPGALASRTSLASDSYTG